MELRLDKLIGSSYKSASQIARVVTEHWVEREAFCPNCGQAKITKYPNNKPVADFYCSNCEEDYELKSGQTEPKSKIVDGQYYAMMQRLKQANNPNLLLLHYNPDFQVKNFLVIPKHFFIPDIIEKRKPLSATARRAHWTGCNILLNRVPQTGRIFFVQNANVISKKNVITSWQKTLFLRDETRTDSKGWLLDIMRCIERLGKKNFTLNDMYDFETSLSMLHPENRHIKDKIRQQLQLLRDNGYLKFISKGHYQIT